MYHGCVRMLCVFSLKAVKYSGVWSGPQKGQKQKSCHVSFGNYCFEVDLYCITGFLDDLGQVPEWFVL